LHYFALAKIAKTEDFPSFAGRYCGVAVLWCCG